ncbi:MAG: ABC transporter ATP-binding protein, partial [Dehalococcoidia bacterium]
FTQETQTLVIEVDDKLDELVAALARRGIQATVQGPTVAVEQENDEQYDAIRDAVVEVDARLRRLAPLRHKLTDIFRSAPR